MGNKTSLNQHIFVGKISLESIYAWFVVYHALKFEAILKVYGKKQSKKFAMKTTICLSVAL
jgi:hypothetical protein